VGLDAGCRIHLDADRGVDLAAGGTEVADRGVAGVDSHSGLERGANPEVEPLVTKGGEAALHVEGHTHRGHGVLLRVGAPGCAEEDHDAVAFEVVDRRSMGLGALGHLLEVVIEDEREVLGIEFVGEFGEALDVGEEDRELDAVDPEPVLSVPTVQSIGDGRGDVAADEGVGDPEPFLLETLGPHDEVRGHEREAEEADEWREDQGDEAE
jgi:hypothetical protein